MIALDETGDKLIEEGNAVRNLLEIAAGCELHSEHHLADAIVQKSTEMNVEPAPAENVQAVPGRGDRKSTRLNSSHVAISYAVFCVKKKKEALVRYDITKR